jgi:hypothetical protein
MPIPAGSVVAAVAATDLAAVAATDLAAVAVVMALGHRAPRPNHRHRW